MATAKQLAWRKKFAAMSKAGTLRRKKNPAKSSSTRSEVRSPTRTSTSTKADTRGNITVTGGAGRGATTRVTVRRNPVKTKPPGLKIRVKPGVLPAFQNNPKARESSHVAFPWHVVDPDTGRTFARAANAEKATLVAQALADSLKQAFGVVKK